MEEPLRAEVSATVPGVDVAEASALLRDGAVLLDVREPEETISGRAESAVTIPLGDLAERARELPPDAKIVVVCRAGNRSAFAAHALNVAGYDAVNLEGGMLAWRDAGLPIVSEGGGQGIVL